MSQSAPLVLASASPRRRELLGLLGIPFEVLPAHVDESVRAGESPAHYVERVAADKARAVASRESSRLVLAADTTVVLGGEVLGKPESDEQALEMLRRLSGRTHRVMTAMALAGPLEASERVDTEVTFRSLSDEELRWYVSTGEPRDKAGAYGIQGAGGLFVSRIDGSASNVIGLPMAECAALLSRAGHPLPWKAPGAAR